jgi:hypothetical protein
VAGNQGLTGEAVGAAATDGVEARNGGLVGEGAPSPTSELHTSVADIRHSLADDGKHRGDSSSVVIEVTRVICGGRRRD